MLTTKVDPRAVRVEALRYFVCKPKFEIIINVLVISFRIIWDRLWQMSDSDVDPRAERSPKK